MSPARPFSKPLPRPRSGVTRGSRNRAPDDRAHRHTRDLDLRSDRGREMRRPVNSGGRTSGARGASRRPCDVRIRVAAQIRAKTGKSDRPGAPIRVFPVFLHYRYRPHDEVSFARAGFTRPSTQRRDANYKGLHHMPNHLVYVLIEIFPRELKMACRVVLFSAVLFCLSVNVAKAGELTETPVGSKVANFVNVGENQIPLPEGEWEVVATNVFRATTGGVFDGNIGQAFLIQEAGKSGFSAVQVRANTDVSSCSGWKRRKDICDRKDTHYNESDRNYNPQDAHCWNVNHFIINPNRDTKSKYWKEIHQAAKERGIGKKTYIVNSYFRSGRCHFVGIRYYFDPAQFGFTPEQTRWTESGWHKDVIYADSRRQRFVAAVKSAGQRLAKKVKTGFEDNLDGWTSDIVLKFE